MLKKKKKIEHVSIVFWDWKLLGLIKIYAFVLPAYVNTISPSYINARFRLKNVFRFTFRYYFIVIYCIFSVPGTSRCQFYLHVDHTKPAKLCSYLVSFI